jgi:hypothetical protein
VKANIVSHGLILAARMSIAIIVAKVRI